MSLMNTKILPFSTQAYKDGQFVEVTEADVLGNWAVFFFYPADFTFVCPTELGDMADHYDELRELGVEVYSVSTDSHFVHKAWTEASAEVGKIKYYMLGDTNGSITNNFDNMRPDAGQADRANQRPEAGQRREQQGQRVCAARPAERRAATHARHAAAR